MIKESFYILTKNLRNHFYHPQLFFKFLPSTRSPNPQLSNKLTLSPNHWANHFKFKEKSSIKNFLPSFLSRVEIAFRRVDTSVSLPYWDSVMDSYLPTPAESIIWTDDFMGNTQGAVTSGPFSGWRTIENHPSITRKVGAEGSCFNESNLVDFMGFTDINSVLAPTSPRQVSYWVKVMRVFLPANLGFFPR
jgi:hypothetical protein